MKRFASRITVLLLSLCFAASPCAAQEGATYEKGTYLAGYINFLGYPWGTTMEAVVEGEGKPDSQYLEDQTPGLTMITYTGDTFWDYTVNISYAFTDYGLTLGALDFLPSDNNAQNSYIDFCYIQFVMELDHGIPDTYALLWNDKEAGYMAHTPQEYINLLEDGKLDGIQARWDYKNGTHAVHSLSLTETGVEHMLCVMAAPEQLKLDISPAPSPSPQPPYADLDNLKIYPELRNGDCGDDVQRMQRALIAAGYMTGKADGVYAAKTQTAIRAFQKDYLPGEPAHATPRTLAYLFKGPGKDQYLLRKAAATPAPEVIGGVYIAPFDGIRYHKDINCEGLNGAIDIAHVTLRDAQEQGLSACGYCSRHPNTPSPSLAPSAPSQRQMLCTWMEFSSRLKSACAQLGLEEMYDKLCNEGLFLQDEQLLYDMALLPFNDYVTLTLFMNPGTLDEIVLAIIQIDVPVGADEEEIVSALGKPIFSLFYGLDLIAAIDNQSVDKYAEILTAIGFTDMDLNIGEVTFDGLGYRFLVDPFSQKKFISACAPQVNMMAAVINRAVYLTSLNSATPAPAAH